MKWKYRQYIVKFKMQADILWFNLCVLMEYNASCIYICIYNVSRRMYQKWFNIRFLNSDIGCLGIMKYLHSILIFSHCLNYLELVCTNFKIIRFILFLWFQGLISRIKNPPAKFNSSVQFLGQYDLLKKG